MIIRTYSLGGTLTNDAELEEIFQNAFFFDIETTGLSHKYCSIISITVLCADNGIYTVTQLYCQHKPDEADMLKVFRDTVKRKRYCITYNGNSFDISFITAKVAQHSINNFSFDKFVKVDLYRDARKLKAKLNLPDSKLKTIEEHFAIPRNDTFSGQDITVLYEAYTIEPKKEFADLILQHNYEDVANLPLIFEKLLSLYDVTVQLKGSIFRFNQSDITIKKNIMTISLSAICGADADCMYPALNYDMYFDAASLTAKLTIPLYFYRDDNIAEFYYLHSEDYSVEGYETIAGIKKSFIPVRFDGSYNFYNLRILIASILETSLGYNA